MLFADSPDTAPTVGIVYEFLGKGTLKDALSARNTTHIPLELRLHIMLDIARGCKRLHSRGIIHRDLRPGTPRIVAFAWISPQAKCVCREHLFGF